MPNPELLYATSNPGKLDEVGNFLGDAWKMESPKDLGLEIDVEESGETLEENALLKARAFHEAAPDVIVMADDTGLEIDALGGEPGVKVRRWKDGKTGISDDEIVDYCLERMKGVPEGERGAQFRTVIALILPDGTEQLFAGSLRGEIVSSAEGTRVPGFPFRSLLYLPDTGKMLGEDPPPDFKTHREQAVQKAVDWLRDYNK